jgi:hypothetical protein
VLSPGDHVLAVPGERVGVDGRIVNTTPSADRSVSRASAVQAPPVVENANGERRPARAQERIDATDTVLGAPVVVRVGRRPLVAWLRSVAASSMPASGTPRLAVAVVVVLFAILGAGIGGFAPIGTDAGDDAPDGTGPTERTPPRTSTPTPPPAVTATPPVTTTDAPGTPTTASGGSASIDVSVEDPEDVRLRNGRPTSVSAPLSGTVAPDARADSVVVVVQSWVLGHGWAAVARASRTTGDTLSLEELFEEVVIASGDRAGGFANPIDGTTLEYRGAVSVTAVMFDGRHEVGRLSAADGYTLRVTNVAAETGDLVIGEAGATGALFGNDGLRSGDGSTGSGPGVIAPGSNGTNTVTMTNRGSETGTLTISAVSFVSFENGLTGPESAVDTTGGDPGRDAGELHEVLELRLGIEQPDGSRVWVFGNGTAFGSIETLAASPVELGRLAPGDRIDLIVEYRLPTSVGNEIQTDSVTVDVTVTLSGSTG